MPDPVLLDFLYQDAGRVSSYCAQLFEGRLSSLERSASEKEQTDATVKAGIPVLSGERKTATERQSSNRQTIDPHDTAATSLLEKIRPRLASDIATAKNGSLIIATGTLFLFDGSAQSIARVLLAHTPQEITDQVSDGAAAMLGAMGGMLGAIQLPSGFLLKSPAGPVVGTLHERYLSEPIYSYYARHGDRGLPETTLVGILERSAPAEEEPEATAMKTMSAISRAIAGVIRQLTFSADEARVTPILMYREL